MSCISTTRSDGEVDIFFNVPVKPLLCYSVLMQRVGPSLLHNLVHSTQACYCRAQLLYFTPWLVPDVIYRMIVRTRVRKMGGFCGIFYRKVLGCLESYWSLCLRMSPRIIECRFQQEFIHPSGSGWPGEPYLIFALLQLLMSYCLIHWFN